MKTTLIYTAAAALFGDAASALHLPVSLQVRQQQHGPRCSVYSGFKDSQSFTSYCKQRPQATRAQQQPSISAASSSYAQGVSSASTGPFTPSISTQYFTFENGQTSTLSPIDPIISSAAASNTYVMGNYTITTSGMPSYGPEFTTSRQLVLTSSQSSSMEFEVHCEIGGSTLPMSECTRTAGLTRHHGYTYTPSTALSLLTTSSQLSQGASASAPSAASSSAAISSAMAAFPTVSSTTGRPTFSLSGKPPSKKVMSSSRAGSSAATPSVASSGPVSSSAAGVSSPSPLLAGTGMSLPVASTNCGNITGAEPHSSGPAPIPSLVTKSKTPAASSSAVASQSSPSSAAPASSTASALSASTTSAPLASSDPISSTIPKPSSSFTNSYDCNNITAAEPHQSSNSKTPVGSPSSVVSPSSVMTPSSVVYTSSGVILTTAAPNTVSLSSSSCTNTNDLTRHGGYTYPDTFSSSCTNTNELTRQGGYTYPDTLSLPSCTNTNDLTRQGGYTYPDTLSLIPLSTSAASSDGAAESASTSSVGSPTPASNPATFSTSYVSSAACNADVTGAEPHKLGSSTGAVQPTNSAGSSSSEASSISTVSPALFPTFDCSTITGAEPHYTGSSMAMVVPVSEICKTFTTTQIDETATVTDAEQQWTSTTTVVDAIVTTVVPCPTATVYSAPEPEEKKRDLFSFMAPAADKLCNAGVYCVNSTFVSDAPPSWEWDAVPLMQGQICVEDDVFNTNWLELQCACAGL